MDKHVTEKKDTKSDDLDGKCPEDNLMKHSNKDLNVFKELQLDVGIIHKLSNLKYNIGLYII